MCSGLFKSPPRVVLPPPSKPDPSIAIREGEIRDQNLSDQSEASKARKKQIQAGFGRRSLLTSSGGGYLSNTKNNTNLS